MKATDGNYLRKTVPEKDYFHVWDYNKQNQLVTESFYTDTNFTRKFFCHKYFDEKHGYLRQTRCYENGRLQGYAVGYNASGDTTSYEIYEQNTLVKSWGNESSIDASVFTKLESAAEIPGGKTARVQYLVDNLNYPKALRKEKTSGVVKAQILIDRTGRVSEVVIIKSLHPLLDQEVIRVMKASPTWKPAIQNGKAVIYRMSQSVTF